MQVDLDISRGMQANFADAERIFLLLFGSIKALTLKVLTLLKPENHGCLMPDYKMDKVAYVKKRCFPPSAVAPCKA
jgi:hypothetical protein